jgi:guanylate kinase
VGVLVVTGPSGVGKGTLIRRLLERLPEFELSVSATTRPPRPGEVEGRDYHFLTLEEFERRLARGEFLEHAVYAGNMYGTPRSELDRARAAGKALVLEIEVQGARQVGEALPGAMQVFIAPPSEATLRERLEHRSTDSQEEIERRLARAREELSAASEWSRVIVNDDLDRATEELVELAATIVPRRSPKERTRDQAPPG